MKLDLSKKRIIIFAAIVFAVVLIVVLAVVAFGGRSEDVDGPASSVPFQDYDEFNKSSEMTSSDKQELEDLWNEAVGNTSGESSSNTSSDGSSSNGSSSSGSSSSGSSSVDSSDSESDDDGSMNAVIDGSRPGYI